MLSEPGGGFSGPSPLWWLVGALLLSAVFLRCRRRWRRKIFLWNGEFGSISIATGALVMVIRNACRSAVPGAEPRIRVVTRRCALRIRIRLTPSTGGNVRGIAQRVQQCVAASLREQLDVEKIGSIDVLIGGFRSRPPARKGETEAAPPETQ
ncbi:MAG: hypothetical protein LBS68_01760 [Puniceicoccales bacterium]|jgi:hypothetical protein|nr:hypothetical protein [Puniceicoccales bacterium]